MSKPQIHYTHGFLMSARSDPEMWDGIRAAIDYLTVFRRQAVRPFVGWRLALSVYGDCSGEVLWPNPEYQSEHPDAAWRGLFVTNPNCDWFLFTVLGNKARYPGGSTAWYDAAVPESDQIAKDAASVLDLPDLPKL